MKIEILPASVANMIAAGEVVQGPSSIVKEMMENSADAGAGSITVILKDAGRTLVRIIDDGSGMSKEDALLCFERHATSKISRPEDLEAIRTYGFRGEALASIAAVAEVTLKTRRSGDETGTLVEYADSKLVSVGEVAASQGSDFSVRNLFYNVPARRKFLKSDAAEFRKVLAEFSRMALTRPDLSLRLIHNDKDIHDLRPAPNVKVRIADLLGKEIPREIVEASAETSLVGISGYVGNPEYSRKSQQNQYFFVNGRFFRSPYLHKAVMKAYDNLIVSGTFPSYFLYLSIDPAKVDVNIHPAKTEVKFEDEQVIFQIVYACVREALGKNSFVQSIDFDVEGVPEIPVFNPRDTSPVKMPRIDVDASYNPFERNREYAGPDRPSVRSDTGYVPVPPRSYGSLFEEDAALCRDDVVVLGGKYIIYKEKDALKLVDILRARERILYSRMIQSVAMGEILTQSLLYPVEREVGAHGVSVIEEHSEILSETGFDIRPFGETTVMVYGLPSGYGMDSQSVADILDGLIASFDDDPAALKSVMISRMAVRLSHISALADKSVPDKSEARALIGQLSGCEDSSTSPYSGKRCYTTLTVADLERLLTK